MLNLTPANAFPLAGNKKERTEIYSVLSYFFGGMVIIAQSIFKILRNNFVVKRQPQRFNVILLLPKKVMGDKYHKIVDEINKFCQRIKVSNLKRVHIGITKDPNRRLFNEHKITNEDYWWVHCKAKDEETARTVELHFLRMGMHGGTGGGDSDTIYVYCFAKK